MYSYSAKTDHASRSYARKVAFVSLALIGAVSAQDSCLNGTNDDRSYAPLLYSSLTFLIDQGCGRPAIGCMYKCPFGFPCYANDDCLSSSCTASFCDVGRPAGFKPPVPIVPPPSSGKSWSISSVTATTDFKTILKDSYGQANRAFVKDPVGAGTVIRVR
jgi:hypothetical protein